MCYTKAEFDNEGDLKLNAKIERLDTIAVLRASECLKDANLLDLHEFPSAGGFSCDSSALGIVKP